MNETLPDIINKLKAGGKLRHNLWQEGIYLFYTNDPDKYEIQITYGENEHNWGGPERLERLLIRGLKHRWEWIEEPHEPKHIYFRLEDD